MISKKFYTIFKQGSKTYFYSSLFFPADVKSDVFTLYSFVRTADDFVDQQPPQKNAFYSFRKLYNLALTGQRVNNDTITAYVALTQKRKFKPEWTESFLDAMESDLHVKKYDDLAHVITYMYGSAEIIGLMMARILSLPPRSLPLAQALGRAMQYVNFIRDVPEDVELGRNYFPTSEMKRFGLKTLKYSEVSLKQSQFEAFLTAQIQQYYVWQMKGEKGFEHIPKRYLIPIKTASDLYKWTAKEIIKNPMIVYQRKMKPPMSVIAVTLVKNFFTVICS